MHFVLIIEDQHIKRTSSSRVKDYPGLCHVLRVANAVRTLAETSLALHGQGIGCFVPEAVSGRAMPH